MERKNWMANALVLRGDGCKLSKVKLVLVAMASSRLDADTQRSWATFPCRDRFESLQSRELQCRSSLREYEPRRRGRTHATRSAQVPGPRRRALPLPDLHSKAPLQCGRAQMAMSALRSRMTSRSAGAGRRWSQKACVRMHSLRVGGDMSQFRALGLHWRRRGGQRRGGRHGWRQRTTSS
jgi:hypothetical protein